GSLRCAPDGAALRAVCWCYGGLTFCYMRNARTGSAQRAV
ncbi:hypothetical protein A2U01_0116849, partial [Trifolium medium]|nr:hypothetical protein [Trifolium medium]